MPYFVDPAVGASGAGTSWATAFKTLLEATAAAGAGEIIYFSNATADVLTTNATYSLATGVQVISTAGATTVYAAGATVSSVTFGVDILVRGAGSFHGVSLLAATTGTSTIQFCDQDNNSILIEDGLVSCPTTTTGAMMLIGTAAITGNVSFRTKRTKFRFGSTGQWIRLNARWESDGDTFADTGAAPAVLLKEIWQAKNSSSFMCFGADLSNISGTLVSGNLEQAFVAGFSSCKLHPSVTPIDAAVSLASTDIQILNCAYDAAGTLTGRYWYHENFAGSTTISTSIYANDTPTFDGTSRVSWVVDGTAGATLANPYRSPWLKVYNGDVSTAITPYLEVLRDGSSTPYTDEQVWVEFAYRGTADAALLTYVNDRRGWTDSAANQTASSKGASDWTGEAGTAWFGKLAAPSAFTPQEKGYILARVNVAGDYTVYVSPMIRGLA